MALPSIVRLHPHAVARVRERGATKEDVEDTVLSGEKFEAKMGRLGFRKNIPGDFEWRGRRYATKQVEVYAVHEDGSWLVITALVKFF